MKTNRLPRHGLAALFLLLSIAACATKPPVDPPVEVRTITVETAKFVPLLPGSTVALPEPAAPAPTATDPATGLPVMANGSLADYADALKAWGRALAAKLASIATIQPPTAPDAPQTTRAPEGARP
jgi:hypothetical protein